MKKKLYLRITAVALVFIFAISPIKIFAGEKEVEREEKYDNATAYEYILPYTDNNYHLYKFYIYTPTGNGNGQYRLQENYYDIENSYGYSPSMTIEMGTNVICDFMADVFATDQWGLEYELYVRRDQSYNLYGQRTFNAVNTAWTSTRGELYVADDEGEGYFEAYYEDHN